MKIIFFLLLSVITIVLSADDREDLLAVFAKENAMAESLFQSAMTTVEMTGAAGNLWEVSESQYLRALNYKLLHTPNNSERLNILKDFHNLSREIQKIYDTPRENQGSSIGMRIYHHIANLYQQKIAILMLDAETEKRWKQIADSVLFMNGRKIELKQGKAEFEAIMYDEKVTLEFILLPKNTFVFQGRNFAVIRTDIRFAGNDDFSTVYLCELKNDQMHVYTKCKFPYFSKWTVQNDDFVIYDNGKVQKIKLR